MEIIRESIFPDQQIRLAISFVSLESRAKKTQLPEFAVDSLSNVIVSYVICLAFPGPLEMQVRDVFQWSSEWIF